MHIIVQYPVQLYYTLYLADVNYFFLNVFLDFSNNLWYVVVLGRQVSTLTTLENLYYGNIAPHEYEVVRGSEYDITAKLVIRHEQE